MSRTDPETAWVLAAAGALRRHGSWTGRIHIQKHLFITKALGLAAPPFDFVLYDYGPYSFELDEQIVELELFGQLARSYPLPGYGPTYEPTISGQAGARELADEDMQVVERVASVLGDRKSSELELIATCLWFEEHSGAKDNEQIVCEVQRAKPKYGENEIRASLSEARAVASTLRGN